MALKSGSYEVKTTKKVVVWPAPDANGDGAKVLESEYDHAGNVIGQNYVKDRHDREVREYFPPEGFQNRPGYDHSDNYVLCDERGVVQRDTNGEAIYIRPGQALIFEPDGSVTRVQGQHAQYLWEQAHNAVEDQEVTE